MSKMPDNIKKMWEEAAKYGTGANKQLRKPIFNPHSKPKGIDIHGKPVDITKYPKTGPGPEPNPTK